MIALVYICEKWQWCEVLLLLHHEILTSESQSHFVYTLSPGLIVVCQDRSTLHTESPQCKKSLWAGSQTINNKTNPTETLQQIPSALRKLKFKKG